MGRGLILGAGRLRGGLRGLHLPLPQLPPIPTYTSASQLGLVNTTCSYRVCPLWFGESTCQ